MLTPIKAYLRWIDRALPGFLTGLHLTGSVALDDYHPNASDIDFVAVVARPPRAADLAALEQVHQGLEPRPHLDGVYLTTDQLAAQPSRGEPAPHSLDGEFRGVADCFQLNPVLWAELAQGGVTVRGQRPDIRTHPEGLRAWNLGNLRSYWQPYVAQCRQIMTGHDQAMALPHPEALPWLVTGPPRLHFTIATGHVVSKTTAAEYASTLFPRWADVIAKALAVRSGRAVTPTVADMAEAADLAEAVIDDALSARV